MDIERKGDSYQIRLEEGENKRDVLRAIAVASFELARPAGMGRLNFSGGSTLRPEDADRFIEERQDKISLHMDYVEGRQVKTNIQTVEDGSLDFDGRLFERDRGNPKPVFERANEILKSRHPAAALPVELTSTKDQFKGDSLTSRLKELGYTRTDRETDEQFRGRIFPNLFRKDAILASEFIFGKHQAEWTEEELIACTMLIRQKPSEVFLNKFAENLTNSDTTKK